MAHRLPYDKALYAVELAHKQRSSIWTALSHLFYNCLYTSPKILAYSRAQGMRQGVVLGASKDGTHVLCTHTSPEMIISHDTESPLFLDGRARCLQKREGIFSLLYVGGLGTPGHRSRIDRFYQLEEQSGRTITTYSGLFVHTEDCMAYADELIGLLLNSSVTCHLLIDDYVDRDDAPS